MVRALMAKVLFLAHRYPYPPNKGDKIRAFHFTEHLRARHEVTLGFVTTPGDTEPDLSWARKFSAFYEGRIPQAQRLFRAGMALLTGAPLSVAVFYDPALARWVARHVAEKRPDVIFAFSSAMAQYVPRDLPAGTRFILDFCDVDSEKWRQYAQSQSLLRRWFFGMEARRLVAFDREQAKRAAASLFVMEDERRIFDRLSPETAARHRAIGNGVDVAYHDPAAVTGRPSAAKTIAFVGMMDYWPNVDAVTWFAKEIFPLVRARHPDARFQIVGARPVPSVRALARIDGVEVTGAVADVRPYVKGATVVVAPLRIARGIQNKVLEGMAMARPVVTSPAALEGINAEHERHVLVGETPNEFADAVVRVLDAGVPADIGAAARAFVVKNHDWDANLEALDGVLRG